MRKPRRSPNCNSARCLFNTNSRGLARISVSPVVSNALINPVMLSSTKPNLIPPLLAAKPLLESPASFPPLVTSVAPRVCRGLPAVKTCVGSKPAAALIAAPLPTVANVRPAPSSTA